MKNLIKLIFLLFVFLVVLMPVFPPKLEQEKNDMHHEYARNESDDATQANQMDKSLKRKFQNYNESITWISQKSRMDTYMDGEHMGQR